MLIKVPYRKSQTHREAGTESHGSLDFGMEMAGLPGKTKGQRGYFNFRKEIRTAPEEKGNWDNSKLSNKY